MSLESQIRAQYNAIQTRFPPSNGKASLDVWLQCAKVNGIQDPAFITALSQFSLSALKVPHVAGVLSLTTLDKSTSLQTYISVYSDPFSSANYNITKRIMHPFGISDLNRITRVSVSLTIDDSDKKLGEAVRGVRNLLSDSFIVGNTKLIDTYGVSGRAAYQYDSNTDILGTIPYVIAVIVCSMYVLVLLLTGSILIPIKTIICAVLSVCCSFGILVEVIQENNGSSFLHFDNTKECLDPIQLVFIFIVAFGLSLDYEIFMLGCIQEVYEKTGDNEYAVCRGIQTSARTVTVAAVLLVVAVGGFLASNVLVLKQIGIGIGLTIVMDATLMRCILVPAYMGLFPPYWNWWAPAPIKKIVDILNLKENH